MQRRGWTVAVGAVLVGVLTWLVLWVEVPYVAFVPGPTVDTLRTDTGRPSGDKIVRVDGAEESESEGQFRMVTVSVIDRPRLIEAIWYWISDDYAVVPREFVYPPDKTDKDIENESKEQFASSQASAETAALRELGCPVHVTVTGFTSGSPVADELREGDVISGYDGEPVTSAGRLEKLLADQPKQQHTVAYVRDGKRGELHVTPAESKEKLLGLFLKQQQPCEYDVEFDSDVQKIGGPSAGLIFALTIIDKVQPEDLTGGLKIAGTGEIDDDGTVGSIGGVPQKMLAAKRDGATVFLVPQDNCDEAVANDPGGLTLLEVGTLDDALAGLQALRTGGEARLCGT
ncbi:MAG: YlbL family protein [Micromonosporaceae bacterium]